MNNTFLFPFISGLTGAALAVAMAATQPAQAYITHDNGVGEFTPSDFTGVHAELVRQLNKNNVVVFDGATVPHRCKAKPGFILHGSYYPKFNVIVLCPGFSTESTNQTLTHEAVHAYQDLRTGLSNDTLIHSPNVLSLFDQLSPHHKEAVLTYPEAHQLVEVEAWYFQSRPQTVLKAWTF